MTAPTKALADGLAQAYERGRADGWAALSPERLAQMFHEAYERLAPSFGYETRKASAKPWAEVPANNRALMTTVAAEILAALRPTAATCGIENGEKQPCVKPAGHTGNCRVALRPEPTPAERAPTCATCNGSPVTYTLRHEIDVCPECGGGFERAPTVAAAGDDDVCPESGTAYRTQDGWHNGTETCGTCAQEVRIRDDGTVAKHRRAPPAPKRKAAR